MSTKQPPMLFPRTLRFLSLGLISAITAMLFAVPRAQAADSVPAWCYDGTAWLGYAEDIPGSSDRETFTQCLQFAAQRGTVTAFDAKIADNGVLFDLGANSLFWTLPNLLSLDLAITAYEQHVMIEDNCGRIFQLRADLLQMTASGFACEGQERIREDPRSVADPDFTIYILDTQFILDAPDGWYHIVRDRTDWGEDPTRRGQIILKAANGAIWVTADTEIPEASGGAIFDIHRPVANTAKDRQQFLAYDWEERVTEELIPQSFDDAATYLLPDWPAYWREVRLWLAAIRDDLLGPVAEPIYLEVLDGADWKAYASGRTIYISYASAAAILHELAHVIAGDSSGHDGRFVATLLDIWERYIPDFDGDHARALAQRYGVEVGEPAHLQPVSDRTRTVLDLFAKTPPSDPSDEVSIPADMLLRSITLHTGRTYHYAPQTIVAASPRAPSCIIEERAADGTIERSGYGPIADFTVNPGGTWNGLAIQSYGDDQEAGAFVAGTPVAPGRVRVKISTQCPGGFSQSPRLVGYSEIIVVNPGP